MSPNLLLSFTGWSALKPAARLVGISPRFLRARPQFLPTAYKRFNATIALGATPERSEKTADIVSEAEAVKDRDEQENVEETTGEIEKKVREGIFYFDNIYPVAPGRYSIPSQLLARLLGLTEKRVETTILQHAFPADLPVKFTQLIPRYKDGGAFAKYEISSSAPSLTHDEVEAAIYSYLKTHDFRPIFNPFRRMRVFAVLGVPWIEDLKRSSSKQVRVVFEGPDLSQEEIYKILRRYGTIIDIVPPAPAAKDLPRSALVEFQRLRDSCTARNCVNSLKVGGTKIHITYVSSDKTNWFKKTILDHQRISIPLILALFATLAVIIFEPIRTFFIKRKICNNNNLEKYAVISWVVSLYKSAVSTLSRYLHFENTVARFEDLWSSRQDSINMLQQWIEENANTFIVVNGPRGSGKRELVTGIALNGRPNVLQIDCETLLKSRNETAFLKAASSQLGYYPVFPWMKNLTAFGDLIVQGLTGQKTGLSESIDTQFKSMLTTTITALREIALENYKSADSAIKISEEDYLQLHAEAKPVVVISHFENREGDASTKSNQFIYKQLADFAAVAVSANVAHVIFITNDVSFENTLSPALPNHLFKVLTIGDADPQSAKSFVLQQISEANKTSEKATDSGDEKVLEPKASDYPNIDEALKPLGGRMTDLQSFSRRIMSGEQPLRASKDMIDQSASELLQMYLLRKNPDWTTEQVWVLIKKLAALETTQKDRDVSQETGWFGTRNHVEPVHEHTASPTLPYTDLLADPNFKTFEQQQSLLALQHCEMITLLQEGGRPVAVKAGKPLFQAAFKALVSDKELTALMETQLLNKLVSSEESKINKFEEELLNLSKLPNRWEVKQRIDYLADKLTASQTKVQDYETRLKAHAEILAKSKK